MNTLDGATRNELLDYLTNYPADIGRIVGFKDFTDLHNGWLKKMILPPGDFTLQAHRGSYKTTCLSLAIAFRLIFYPEQNIIFMRKTGGDVVEVIKQVSKILHSDVFGYIFKRIYGYNLEFVGENSGSITLNNYTITRGASQLLGIGTVGSLTGKHADVVITDDIVNLQDRISKAERDRVKGVYQELQNIRNRGGVIINTGTPWHKEDAFSLMPNIERYDCYHTNMLSASQIETLRHQMSPSLFAANYELRHIASDSALFDTEPRFYQQQYDKTGTPINPLRDGIAHIDAAYGGEDYTAFTCGRREGDTLYMYGKIWHNHVDTVLSRILEEAERLACAPIYCEDNADKGFLAKEIRRLKPQMPVRVYHENENKFQKISEYLRKWWRNIVWLEGTDREYLAQIMDFTEDAEHDDAPDSAACVCRRYDRRSLTEYKSVFGGG